MSLYTRQPGPRHWHITRGIKPRGECPACDALWRQFDTKNTSPETGTPPPEGDSPGDSSVTDKNGYGHP